MQAKFTDRSAAGRLLAAQLASRLAPPDPIVLALPRGGVPVAREIAAELHAPLDVVVVRKLGVPGEDEVAFGALASPGIRVLNRAIIAEFGVTPVEVERVAAREHRELRRRERVYRGRRPALGLHGRPVILVDDGIATGATMRAAIAVLRQEHAGRITVATPVAAREAYLELRGKVDDFVVLRIPKEFSAVGAFYEEFPAVTDAEVSEALEPVVV